MPKVSVIVPIYGVELYIERCVRSLMEQTLDDIEYIFINDCTKDNSMEILGKVIKEYPERSNFVKIINLEHNSGLPAVRKKGISLATGKYIVHCDSDDWVEYNAYEIMYKKAESTDSDIIFCDYYESDGIKKKYVQPNDFGPLDSKNIIKYIVKGMLWTIWRVMAKKEIYQNDIIYPLYNNGEDFALLFQLVFYSSKFAHIEQPLYYYFVNKNSISHNIEQNSDLKRIDQFKKNIELIIKFFIKVNVISKYSIEIKIMKLHCRLLLLPENHPKDFYYLWHSIYNEIDNDKIELIFNKKIPLYLRVRYLMGQLRLYKIYDKFRKNKIRS